MKDACSLLLIRGPDTAAPNFAGCRSRAELVDTLVTEAGEDNEMEEPL